MTLVIPAKIIAVVWKTNIPVPPLLHMYKEKAEPATSHGPLFVLKSRLCPPSLAAISLVRGDGYSRSWRLVFCKWQQMGNSTNHSQNKKSQQQHMPASTRQMWWLPVCVVISFYFCVIHDLALTHLATVHICFISLLPRPFQSWDCFGKKTHLRFSLNIVRQVRRFKLKACCPGRTHHKSKRNVKYLQATAKTLS